MNSRMPVSAMKPAAADDDDVLRRVLHLAHEVAGDQDGAPLRGEVLEQIADPDDALGVQAVDGLVEQQRRRIAEQGGGDAEALEHAQ